MAENFNIVTNDEVENFVVDFGEVIWVTNNSFNTLDHRPSYAGQTMTGETNIPEVPTNVSQLNNDSNYQTNTEVAAAVNAEAEARRSADETLSGRIDAVAINLSNEERDRRLADNGLQSQIDAVTASSDVVDIVGTYAELQTYPTAGLSDKDVIKVLQDSTHNDAMSYFRWDNSASEWNYIGSEGPYYTKSETNAILNTKQDKLTAGDNIQIENNVISATDTTYTAGNGINIDEQNVISTDAPEGFFTLPATVGGEGSEITLNNTIVAKLDDAQVDGDTYQQTYSGFQLVEEQGLATPKSNSSYWSSFTNLDKTDLDNGWATFISNASATHNFFMSHTGAFEWETGTTYTVILEIKNAPSAGAITLSQPQNVTDPFDSISVGSSAYYQFTGQNDVFVFSGVTKSSTTTAGLRAFLSSTFVSSVTLRLTIIAGDHTTDYQNYIGDNWEPYVGGTPSPNPDYPQDIQTVTGEQTVEVSDSDAQSQSYIVDLGSIELCKIGDYEDNIFNNDPTKEWYNPNLEDNAWYVHKATGKIALDGSETWTAAQMTNNWLYYTINAGMAVVTSSQMPNIVSNYFSVTTTDGQWTSVAGSKSVTLNNIASPNTQIRFTVGDSTNKLTDFKTWLGSNNTTVYYPLATPTDTQITDAMLVGQLEALWNAMSYNGQTDFVVTASGSGALPAILEVKAYQKSLNGLLGAIERMGE